jgi:UDP-N-acetylglucosamine:LPS N-acetylglucosamine transferase
MGSGHNQVARELSGRLSERAQTRTVDLLEILPWRIGHGLRSGYAAMLNRAPWLYDQIFQAFFVPRNHWQPSTSPLVTLAARRLQLVVTACQPSAVVSTFHLAGQAAGWLRQRGRLAVPSVVVITEPASHALWAHPGTDLFVCPYPWVAEDARRATKKPALVTGPVVSRERPSAEDAVTVGRRALRLQPGEDAVLISTGSWGVGDVEETVDELAGLPGVRAFVLCGRNERLRRRVDGRSGCRALAWRADLPTLFAAARVLVDNAGGTTCAEAFAAGLPVVAHRPLPGHGRAGVRALTNAGLVRDGQSGLRAAVQALLVPGAVRDEQCRRAAAVFRADPGAATFDWLTRPELARSTPPHQHSSSG